MRVLTLLVVAAAAGLGSLALALPGSDAPRGLMHVDDPTMALLIGWSFAGAGVLASALRPDNRFGLLLYGTGLTWFASALMATDSPVPFTVGLVTAPWWLGVFLHALLAFPGRRLEGPWPRMLVALLYLDVTLVQGLRLLFTTSGDLPGCSGCPSNVLLLSDQPDVAAAILVAQQAGVGSLVIGGDRGCSPSFASCAVRAGWVRAAVPRAVRHTPPTAAGTPHVVRSRRRRAFR